MTYPTISATSYSKEALAQLCQEQFPQVDTLCYLNHAAVSPWPQVTADAIANFAQENVHTGARNYLKWMEQETRLRQHLAQLINANSVEEIALAKSTSEALSIIAYGLTWEAGDQIIISNQEFPSNRIVWESLADQGVEVVEADFEKQQPIDAIASCFTERTRLVSISTVQYASGIRIDCEALSRLCKEHGALLCLDAIQSLGALEFDQQKIAADFIVADGHKWMMAGEGLALLYVNAAHIEHLTLRQYGWHMVAKKGQYDEHEWQPAKDATRFECGSPNMLGIYALSTSLEFLLSIGIEQVEQSLLERVRYLKEKLSAIPNVSLITSQAEHECGGIVTFKVSGADHAALYSKLMKNDVICAHRGGGIRFSPGFYTPFETIDLGIERLTTLLAEAP